MIFNKELSERMFGNRSRMLARAEPDIPILVEEENWGGLAGVASGACNDALQLMMLEIRCHKNFSLAKEYILRARNAAKILKAIPDATVEASNFTIPIYCCLLAHDLVSAQQLANAAIRQNETPGSHFDIHAKILAACVSDDPELFQTYLHKFNQLSVLYWWQVQKNYFDLYSSILQRDELSFSSLLESAIDKFEERANDKDFGDQLSEYGGLEYNRFSIDFMATGVTILARSKGMVCSVNYSEFLPPELVE